MFVYELIGCVFESRSSQLNFQYTPVSRKEFLDIQATAKCRFTLKRVFDMIRTHSLIRYTVDSPYTAWKVSKYGDFPGPYFPALGPEKNPYLDTFHAVLASFIISKQPLADVPQSRCC